MPEPVIRMRGICKAFPGVIANDHVSFDVQPGEIHALLGENGAGKSTLMNILAGLYRPDAGQILIDGIPRTFHKPREAIVCGIGMIHQHFKLVEAFTVAENVVMGDRALPGYVNHTKLKGRVADLAREYAIDLDPDAYIWQLSVGEQQRVEILKALYRDARILVLDEPTAVLTPQEADKLFTNLRQMTKLGRTVIIITHKLAEVCEIAHSVTVLKQGKSVGTVGEEGINYRNLSAMLLGHDWHQQEVQERAPGPEALVVKDLCVPGDRGPLALDHLSFTLREGEILAVAGVSGNGQKELAEALAGLRAPRQGSILLNGQPVTGLSARQMMKRGVAFVPEDRLGTGLVGNMNVMDNLILKDYYSGCYTKAGIIGYKQVERLARDVVRDYEVAVSDIRAPVRLMSGGNLQKVLLARELSYQPRVLIAAYPVRGLDLGASEMIYRLIMQQRDRGCAVLLISEDLEAVMRYGDRVMVLYRGHAMGILTRQEARAEELGAMMLGTTLLEVAQSYEKTFDRT